MPLRACTGGAAPGTAGGRASADRAHAEHCACDAGPCELHGSRLTTSPGAQLDAAPLRPCEQRLPGRARGPQQGSGRARTGRPAALTNRVEGRVGPRGRAWAQRARGGGLPGQRGVQRGRQARQAGQAQAQRAAVPQQRLHLRRARLRGAARLRACPPYGRVTFRVMKGARAPAWSAPTALRPTDTTGRGAVAGCHPHSLGCQRKRCSHAARCAPETGADHRSATAGCFGARAEHSMHAKRPAAPPVGPCLTARSCLVFCGSGARGRALRARSIASAAASHARPSATTPRSRRPSSGSGANGPSASSASPSAASAATCGQKITLEIGFVAGFRIRTQRGEARQATGWSAQISAFSSGNLQCFNPEKR